MPKRYLSEVKGTDSMLTVLPTIEQIIERIRQIEDEFIFAQKEASED